MTKQTRIFVDIVLVVSTLVLPWWASFVLAVYLLFKFQEYLEFVFWGTIMDTMYGVGSGFSFTENNYFFIFSLILYIILSKLKQHIRLHA